MRRRIPTIPRREQNSLFRRRLAKRAAVLSTDQPWENGHSPTGRNPVNRLTMLGHEGGKLPQILSGSFLRFAEDNIPVSHRSLRQHLSGSIVRNRKNSARIPVEFAALGIVLDHPTCPHSG